VTLDFSIVIYSKAWVSFVRNISIISTTSLWLKLISGKAMKLICCTICIFLYNIQNILRELYTMAATDSPLKRLVTTFIDDFATWLLESEVDSVVVHRNGVTDR
jgi:hypothetical protein